MGHAWWWRGRATASGGCNAGNLAKRIAVPCNWQQNVAVVPRRAIFAVSPSKPDGTYASQEHVDPLLLLTAGDEAPVPTPFDLKHTTAAARATLAFVLTRLPKLQTPSTLCQYHLPSSTPR